MLGDAPPGTDAASAAEHRRPPSLVRAAHAAQVPVVRAGLDEVTSACWSRVGARAPTPSPGGGEQSLDEPGGCDHPSEVQAPVTGSCSSTRGRRRGPGAGPRAPRPAGGRSGTPRRSRPRRACRRPLRPSRTRASRRPADSGTPVGNWCVGVTNTASTAAARARRPASRRRRPAPGPPRDRCPARDLPQSWPARVLDRDAVGARAGAGRQHTSATALRTPAVTWTRRGSSVDAADAAQVAGDGRAQRRGTGRVGVARGRRPLTAARARVTAARHGARGKEARSGSAGERSSRAAGGGAWTSSDPAAGIGACGARAGAPGADDGAGADPAGEVALGLELVVGLGDDPARETELLGEHAGGR